MMEALLLDLIHSAPSLATLLDHEEAVVQCMNPELTNRFEERRAELTAPPSVTVVPTPMSIPPRRGVPALDRPLPVRHFPHRKTRTDKEGNEAVTGLLPTVENLRHLLKAYGVSCAYNEMSRVRVFSVPGHSWSMDNADNNTLTFIENLCVINGMNFGGSRLNDMLTLLAEENTFHPVRRWIESQAWDGISRLQSLCDTLAVLPRYAAHRDSMLNRWLIGAVAVLYSDSLAHKFENVLTLQGAQYAGKTSWYKRLAPAEMDAVKEGFQLNPHTKDHVFAFNSYWIVELGEVDSTFSKTEMGSLKAFLSNSSDRARRPFARLDSTLKRQTIAGASVNKPDYLIDETGNRRWMTLPVLAVNGHHEIDMQQLWAEVKTKYDAGEQWWLTKEENERLGEVNKGFEATTAVGELLEETFDFAPVHKALPGLSAPRELVKITATQALLLFGLPKEKRNVTEAGAALRRLTGAEPVSAGGARVWRVCPRRDSRYFSQVREVLGEPNLA